MEVALECSQNEEKEAKLGPIVQQWVWVWVGEAQAQHGVKRRQLFGLGLGGSYWVTPSYGQ